MNRISVEDVSNSIEHLIITGLIVDTKFFVDIHRAIKPEYFQSAVSKILVRWLFDYFWLNEKQSPGEEIFDLFNLYSEELDQDEAVTTRIFLKKILEDYTAREFNRDYVLPKAFEYLEKNAYKHKIKQIDMELKRENLQKAKDIFNGATKEVFEEQMKWRDFSDLTMLRSWWDEKNAPLMSFPGALGKYMPKVERGRLYAMLGPPKRGKTHWLLEWAYNGAIEGLNVAIFSLEMSEKELDSRWKEKISGRAIMEKDKNIFTIPVLDCAHNQKAECEREECVGSGGPVIDGKNTRIAYTEEEFYVPCGKRNCPAFSPSHWMTFQELKRLSIVDAEKTQISFDEHFGKGRIKLRSYPISTATVDDLVAALDDLELHENFIPDLIVVDYADILKEDIKIGEKRHRVGDNWKQLSRMAKTRHVALVTASQGNRHSAKKNRLDIDDVSEDFSKIMTIDAIFAINEENFDKKNKFQMDKYWQIQRIETISCRYSKFVPGLQCVVLNDLDRGQIYLDSYTGWSV